MDTLGVVIDEEVIRFEDKHIEVAGRARLDAHQMPTVRK